MILLSVCLPALPILALLGFLLTEVVTSERARLDAEGQRTALDVADDIHRDIVTLAASLKAFTHLPALRSRDYEQFSVTARRLSETLDLALVLYAPDGRQIVNARSKPGQELPRVHPEVLRLTPEVLRTRDTVVTNVFFGQLAKDWLYVIMVPVVDDGTGQIGSILQLSIPAERVHTILRNSFTESVGVVSVVDSANNVVGQNIDQQDVAGTPSVLATNPGSMEVKLFQAGVGTTGWRAYVGVPEQRFRDVLRRSLTIMAATGLSLFLVLGLAAWLISRQITKPLGQIVGKAVQVGNGEVVQPFRSGIVEMNEVGLALANASQTILEKSRRQNLLTQELNHRVKNTLATVQSMARQSTRAMPPDERDKLETRLLSLSRTHNILTEEAWAHASLKRLIENELNHHTSHNGGPCFRVEGAEDLVVPPRVAVALGMALHELSTNAVKYGALSVPEGEVSVTCGVEGHCLSLKWIERGGPPVQPPERQGFGTRVLYRGLVSELSGSVKLDYQPGGLVCHIKADLE